MFSRLLTVLIALVVLVAGATAHAAVDRTKALKKTPGAKPKYFKALTGGHSADLKKRFLKEGNSKTVDVTAKLAKGPNKVAKKSMKGKKRAAIAARSANTIREVQVIKIDAKKLRERTNARVGAGDRAATLKKNGGR